VISTARRWGRNGRGLLRADAGALHVALADGRADRPAASARQLSERAAILDAARQSGAQAVASRLRLLSEEPGFAEACARPARRSSAPRPGDTRDGLEGGGEALMPAHGVPGSARAYHGDAQEPAHSPAEAIGSGLPVS